MSARPPKKYFDENGLLIIKPYRMKDLCTIFDLNYRTMRSWIEQHKKKIGKRKGQYFNAEQVSFMVGRFGMPYYINNKKEIF